MIELSAQGNKNKCDGIEQAEDRGCKVFGKGWEK